MKRKISLEMLAVSVGITLTVTYPVAQYRLMDRAGMYAKDSNGAYTQLHSPEGIYCQLGAGVGTLALFWGTLCVGGQIGAAEQRRDAAEKKSLENKTEE
jgi:hypothetical protein